MLTNILEQIRNKAYAPNPWGEVLGAPIFAEWPLKEYGLRLKIYKESLQNIKQPETTWGQRAWQALGSFFSQVPERHGWLSDGQYTEENRKIMEAEKRNREQPFRNFGHKEIDSINQKRDTAKPNSTPSSVRYWKLKDSTVNVAGVSNRLDMLFEKFVQYLGVEIKPEFFEITDGIRSYKTQLYYVYTDYINGGSTYLTFTKDFKHSFNIVAEKYPKDKFNKTKELFTPEINPASILLEKEIEKEGVNKNLTMKTIMEVNYSFPHVRDLASDVSVNIKNEKGVIISDQGLARRMQEEAFKSQVSNFVGIKPHGIAGGSFHIHLTFRNK